ncbi:FAD-dependent oxidoreductase [uncultured Desulfobacter sp.]|uniref:FAD-dependent oxidoreductase n=1 Tax=uncultured Desulfobacter sp. TaxID=240139 RepID=UPI002AAB7A54|nr:FAD-dependent oxidoreductase [uncultured Desulfobacter sp.]
MIKTDVIIIGGGATGCGIARDLALRGIGHHLIEKGDFAAGATGACHGLLHSGGRYAVSDAVAAGECIRENKILGKIAEKCVEQTGGLFVRLPEDPEQYRDKFLESCNMIGIETKLLTAEKALKLVPRLNPELKEAVHVPDCSIDPFRLCMLNAITSRNRGGVFHIHHEMFAFIEEKGRLVGVKAKNCFTGEVKSFRGKVIINAGGAWARKIANLAQKDVPMSLSKGSLVITNHRLTNLVINRLRPPSNGDIIVPNEAVCLAGTTAIKVVEPDNLAVGADEVDIVTKEATRLLPDFKTTRLIRAYTGVRPLLAACSDEDSRSISRGFRIINHENGMYSILGGKLTTYRLMAEKIVDTVLEDVFQKKIPCRTAELPLEGQEYLSGYPLSKRLRDMKDIVCGCELVTRKDVESVIQRIETKSIGDIQHRTRLGMGPCQGGFCTYRALGIIQERGKITTEESMETLKAFLQKRFRGIRPALWGNQLQEEQLVEGIYLNLMNMAEK